MTESLKPIPLGEIGQLEIPDQAGIDLTQILDESQQREAAERMDALRLRLTDHPSFHPLSQPSGGLLPLRGITEENGR